MAIGNVLALHTRTPLELAIGKVPVGQADTGNLLALHVKPPVDVARGKVPVGQALVGKVLTLHDNCPLAVAIGKVPIAQGEVGSAFPVIETVVPNAEMRIEVTELTIKLNVDELALEITFAMIVAELRFPEESYLVIALGTDEEDATNGLNVTLSTGSSPM